jgi:hypothetical protein
VITKYFFSLILIFLFSCKARTESEEIINAKWFYYSYTVELDGYIEGRKVKPLTCNIKVNSIEHTNNDTTKFYFLLYGRDTLDICYLKPLGLVGVTVVRNKLYVPIYHEIIFDRESDSLILKNMNKQSLLLQKELQNNKGANSWLQEEAEHRKSK